GMIEEVNISATRPADIGSAHPNEASADPDPAESPRSAEAPRRWTAQGGGRLSYELRGEITGILFPTQSFDVTGQCATGTQLAPVSIYGQTGQGRANGG